MVTERLQGGTAGNVPGLGYQYLESLDSVSYPWRVNADDPAAVSAREVRRLQIFAEVLLTLALGRSVVVPQSWAFDSWGFLQVAETVLRARGGSIPDHPFRLHLFGGAKSYDDAVRIMLSRIGDPHRPFLSSLLPELHDPGYGNDLPRDMTELLSNPWLSGRDESLRLVWEEFRQLPRIAARPRPNPVSLGQVLGHTDAMLAAMPGADRGTREIRANLVDAINRLDHGRPGAFNERSRLRLPDPWPGDAQRRSPLEVAGSQEALDLVITFVDTSYNRVVLDSIGIAPGTFSTDRATGGQPAAARAVAQDCALAAYAAAAGGAGPARRAGQEPLFAFDASRPLADPATRAEVTKLIAQVADSNAAHGLAALLEQRAQRTGSGPGRGPSNPFWMGLDQLSAALAGCDAAAAGRALEGHLETVARILGGRAQAGLLSNRGIQLLLSSGTAAAPVQAMVTWHLPAETSVGLTFIGALMPAVTAVPPMIRRRRNTRRLAQAMGRIVSVRGEAG